MTTYQIPPFPPKNKDEVQSDPKVNIAQLKNKMAPIRYEISLEKGKRWIHSPKRKSEIPPQ